MIFCNRKQQEKAGATKEAGMEEGKEERNDREVASSEPLSTPLPPTFQPHSVLGTSITSLVSCHLQFVNF